MSPRHILRLLTSGLCLLTPALRAEFPTPTNNQPETIPLTPPEKTIGMMHLPPGFKATLFAAEPDVRQPIAMCWDEKGRLWVAENYTYSDGAERFDMKLKDRILIFEDSKNTGHFDKRTVFTEDLQMLTSIERGFGGVYALCPPNLLWIPTKDDKPTGPPVVLLDGFSTTAASRHTFANGLKWGPDGWLYGRIGISSTSWIGVPGTPQEKRQPTAGGIWRYHPTRKIYEPYCHGTTNPWGMDWDEHGEMFFINTVIGHFWHGIQGAHFKRMHGEDPYPHIYDLIDQHADHYHWDTGEKWSDTKKAGPSASTSEKGGGHAHVGLMIYQGTNFPPQYRGKAFMTNLHGRRVNMDIIEREGSGYVAKHGADFMTSDDPWFRAVEIQQGPDGGVYILDWSDIGECHEADGVHRTSGRIYKITYGDPVKPKETDLTKLSDEELVKLQLSDNEWLVRMARRQLLERESDLARNPSWRPLDWQTRLRHFFDPKGEEATRYKHYQILTDLTKGKEVRQQLNGVWSIKLIENTLARVHNTDLLDDPNEFVRSWGIRFLGDIMPRQIEFDTMGVPTEWMQPKELPKLRQLAEEDPSQRVRLEVASLLPRLSPNEAAQLARLLLSHAEDATDHNLPLMYWFGIRDLPPAELVKLVKDCRIPLVRQFIARRVTEEIDKDPAPLNELLRLVPTAAAGRKQATTTGQAAAADPNLAPAKRLASAADPNLAPTKRLASAANSSLAPAKPLPSAADPNLAPAKHLASAADSNLAATNRLTTAADPNLVASNRPTADAEAIPVAGNPSNTTGQNGSEIATDILTGMTDALKGWRKAKKPEAWDKFAAATLAGTSDAGLQKTVRELNVLFGDGRALDEVRAIALDDKADVEARRAALHTLIDAKSPDTRKICEKLLSERGLSVDATQGLATFDDPAIAEAIVKRWRNFYPNEHGAVIAALASRPSFAKVLLKQLGKGVIEHNDISPAVARQIRSFNDPALTKLLADTWGEVHESRDDIKKLITTLKAKLTPEFIAKGNPSQGRFLFTGICAACHKLYGEGANIGPDLTGSGRHEVNYLIENIADPSAVVAADFTMVVVTLKDGRVLNGIIGSKTDRTITLKMVGQEVTVDRNDIAKQQQLPISMMPEGQLTAMNDQQIADLISYLMSNAQVPLPK